MATQNLAQLRAEVRRAHVNATKKVSRLRSKGVEIGGTDVDVRRNIKNIGRYTERQLRTYLRELDTFRERRTQYLRGADGSTISGRLWREYKAAEKRYNEIAERSQKQMRDTFLPSHGMTIGERDLLMRNTSPSATGQRRPLDPIHRKASNVANDKALQRLLRDMRKKTEPGYEAKQVRNQRKIAREMTGETGTKRFRGGLKNLTDKQFNVLWNYTNFPALLSTWYLTRQSESSEWVGRTRDDASGSIDELLEWASTL